MADEPREFALTGQAGNYALLPETPMDVEYESDDGDSGTVIPSIKGPHLVPSAISKPSARLSVLILRGQQAGKFSPNAFIIGDDTVEVAPADMDADIDEYEEYDGPPGPCGTTANHHSAPRVLEEWVCTGKWAHQYPAVLGGAGYAVNRPTGTAHVDDVAGTSTDPPISVPQGPVPAPRLGPVFQAYEDHLKATVSAEVEAHYLHTVTFSMFRLRCVDEASYLSQRHRMLIQRAFALPGFSFEEGWLQAYFDDYGQPHAFDVIIPYDRRRLWVSLLAANTAVGAAEPLPQTTVILQLSRIFQAALDGYKPGKCSTTSRAFARLVSHRLKDIDPAFRDFNVTSDIKWVLSEFTWARRRYRRLSPHRGESRVRRAGDEPVRVAALGLQDLVDRFHRLVHADEDRAIDGEGVDSAVEKEYCPETDTEETAATLRARSNRPRVALKKVGPGKIPWIGYGPDPHDDSDSDS